MGLHGGAGRERQARPAVLSQPAVGEVAVPAHVGHGRRAAGALLAAALRRDGRRPRGLGRLRLRLWLGFCHRLGRGFGDGFGLGDSFGRGLRHDGRRRRDRLGGRFRTTGVSSTRDRRQIT